MYQALWRRECLGNSPSSPVLPQLGAGVHGWEQRVKGIVRRREQSGWAALVLGQTLVVKTLPEAGRPGFKSVLCTFRFHDLG